VSLAAAVVDEVRRRIEARGWSQTVLARAADMSPSVMHRTMKGDRQPTLDELERIADALGISAEYLVRVSRTRTPPDG
jgi:transcriptional regulator with XRE-family HTH domain